MKFRYHRGSLEDSLATEEDFDIDEIKNMLLKMKLYDFHNVNAVEFKIQYYSYDHRCDQFLWALILDHKQENDVLIGFLYNEPINYKNFTLDKKTMKKFTNQVMNSVSIPGIYNVVEKKLQAIKERINKMEVKELVVTEYILTQDVDDLIDIKYKIQVNDINCFAAKIYNYIDDIWMDLGEYESFEEAKICIQNHFQSFIKNCIEK